MSRAGKGKQTEVEPRTEELGYRTATRSLDDCL